MNAEHLEQIESLFHSAMKLEAAERPEFLAAMDFDVRTEIESLLNAHAGSPDFIVSAVPIIASPKPETTLVAGDHVGPYRLVREIGAGGMGAVWLAERDDAQFEKRVAIKLIRPGIRQSANLQMILRRFREERQILAKLEHPNIARLIDGGETADGQPWLALEYVEGERIDDYCKRHQLSFADRLKLFCSVCAAVHYAHQNLIVHRDLKPGNILVGDDGAPKLLDFGIAKLLDGGSVSREVTLTNQRMMTLEYASPEQVRGERLTTVSDVYSLGVILYELLTGRRPYGTAEKSLSEAVRVICEDEPFRPSLAARSEKQRRQLVGDLDNILLMALRKEPGRRYSSVEQFSQDVRRHLEGLPVTASKDTFAYRSAKFVRRNKSLVMAAAMIFLSLLMGIVVVTWQARVAQNQARLAQQERDNARRINHFYLATLSYANPQFGEAGHGKGPDISLAEAIKAGANEKKVDQEFEDQPEVRIDLHNTLGQLWWLRGDHQSAEPHFRAAIELSRQLYGERHPIVIQNSYKLGLVLNANGDYSGAIELIEKAVRLMRENEPENGALPYMLRDLGEILGLQGRFAEAEKNLFAAQEIFKKIPSYDEDPRVASISEYFSQMDLAKGELGQAEIRFQSRFDRLTQLPNIKYEIGYPLFGLGVIHYTRCNYQEAEKSLSQAGELFSQYLGEIPTMAQLLYYLSSIHCRQKYYGKAEAEARRVLEINRRSYSANHPRSIIAMGLLSKVLIRSGQYNQGASILHEAIERHSQGRHKTYYVSFEAVSMLGECMTLLNRYEEAEKLLSEGYEGLQAIRGENSPELVEVRQRLFNLYKAWGKKEKAEQFRSAFSCP